MIEIIKDITQGSDEWFKMRCGSVGASSINKIITSTGKKSTQRKAYLYTLAGEKLTGKKAESYSNSHMENGLVMEEESRNTFEMIHGVEIEEVGLILPFKDAGYHCSPDGIVKGKEEGLELKNVLASTQVKYLDKGVLPTEYKLQIQSSLFVTNWNVWHFFSYHPGLDPLDLKIERDEELITIIKREIRSFIYDLDELVNRLKS